jgi:filamentous hemagglutinin family protein
MITIRPSNPVFRKRLLLKYSDKQSHEINQELIEKISVLEKEKNAILCRSCKNKISSIDEMIEVNGHHRHAFKNPVGIIYQIGCYLNAKGCLVLGNPTDEYTWFPGFQWSLALCSQCFSHLGWFFQSSSDSFFGLILENLVDDSTTH